MVSAARKKRPGCWCAGACPHVEKLHAAEQTPGKLAAVETLARHVLIDAPDCPEAHRALAYVLGSNNRAQLAGVHLARAKAVAGDTPDIAFQIAANLRNQARIPDAITAAEHARNLAPGNIQTHIAVALAYEADGNLESAAAAVASARVRFPRATALRRIEALVIAGGGDYSRAVELLAGDDLTPVELFDRGKFRERLADYAGAWSDWMTAKRIQREREKLIYNAGAMERKLAALAVAAEPARLSRLPRCSESELAPVPIFITGFPRSGTTMIEAALSAHPNVVAGDELMFVPELVERLPAFLNARAPYPRALMALAWPENETVIPLLRDYYIGKALQKIGIGAAGMWSNPPVFFTDKMPSNELHFPLLSLLFPGSPVFHCRRHPLDILLSCMSNYLVHGAFNACDLEWCARHYALTDSLVAHYRDKVPMPMLREIRYETFVQDHRRGVDVLLDWCELPRDERCYDFHLNPWHSRTLSYRQIKEPAHARSVGRYKPFLEFLRPIVPIVQATLDREGYTL